MKKKLKVISIPKTLNQPKINNNLSNEFDVRDSDNKKKIIISTIRKDSLDYLTSRMNSESDFIRTISSLLKGSKRCSMCKSLKTSDNKEFYCTDFEALWYHRDTQFANFNECSYHRTKDKALTFTI
ncbi:MAG: hypothetical protein OEV44_10070 [Spirochaetota bacterium]|nr:hypothetical protein [Spirochaetota bacterium]